VREKERKKEIERERRKKERERVQGDSVRAEGEESREDRLTVRVSDVRIGREATAELLVVEDLSVHTQHSL